MCKVRKEKERARVVPPVTKLFYQKFRYIKHVGYQLIIYSLSQHLVSYVAAVINNLPLPRLPCATLRKLNTRYV